MERMTLCIVMSFLPVCWGGRLRTRGDRWRKWQRKENRHLPASYDSVWICTFLKDRVYDYIQSKPRRQRARYSLSIIEQTKQTYVSVRRCLIHPPLLVRHF